MNDRERIQELEQQVLRLARAFHKLQNTMIVLDSTVATLQQVVKALAEKSETVCH